MGPGVLHVPELFHVVLRLALLNGLQRRGLRGNDTVTRPRLPHAARKLSDGHADGVEAAWSHEDAIDATALRFLL